MITEEINKLNTKLKTKKESINKMENDKEKVDSEILVIEKLKKLIEDAAEAIYHQDLSDMAGLVIQMLNETKKEERKNK